MTKDIKKPVARSAQAWPPLIYHAHIPWAVRIRDVLITIAGWLLLADLLEDIWILASQWLHVTIFKRTVSADHLFLKLWSNTHDFFLMAMAVMAVVVLAGLARKHVLRAPLEKRPQRDVSDVTDITEAINHSTALPSSDGPVSAVHPPSDVRLMRASVQATGLIEIKPKP